MRLKDTLTKIGGMLAIAACCLTSCDYLDVVPPEQAGLKDATKTPGVASPHATFCPSWLHSGGKAYSSVDASTPVYCQGKKSLIPA